MERKRWSGSGSSGGCRRPLLSYRCRHHRSRSVALLPRKAATAVPHAQSCNNRQPQPPAATAAARPPAVAMTAAMTTTITVAAVAAAAKATVMATAAASGRHGESSSVLAAGARMEMSDKFRGEPVDCCLCLCPPPSRHRHCVTTVASPPSCCCRCRPRCRRLVDAMVKKYARVGCWRKDGRQQNKRRRMWLRLQYAQNCRYDNIGQCVPTNDRGRPGKRGSPPPRSIF
jgi:hypothetical protein